MPQHPGKVKKKPKKKKPKKPKARKKSRAISPTGYDSIIKAIYGPVRIAEFK